MNCTQAKADIALFVGGDLEQESWGQLDQHLRGCACCRRHLNELSANLHVLQEVQGTHAAPATVERSLWPRLSPALALADERMRIRRFNGWVASVAVAATCLAMVTMYGELRSVNQTFTNAEPGSYHAVSPQSHTLDTPIHRGLPVDNPVDAVSWPNDRASQPAVIQQHKTVLFPF